MKKSLQKTFLTAAVLALGFNQNANAQWTQTAHNTGAVYCLMQVGTDVFAGGGTTGIVKLTNNGATKTNMNTGLPSNSTVRAMTQTSSALFAGLSGVGVYKSTDNGQNWAVNSTGLPGTSIVWSMTVCDTNVYAGTSDGVYRCHVNGNNWTLINNGISIDLNVYSMATLGTDVFASTSIYCYKSSDKGATWTATSLPGSNHYATISDGGNLYAGTGGFISTDAGSTWNPINSTGVGGGSIKAMQATGTNVFAGNSIGVVLSQAGGTWTAQNSGLNYNDIQALLISGAYLYDGATGGGVWKRPLSEMGVAVSVGTYSSNKNFLLFPNPATDQLTIDLNDTKSANLEILNMEGSLQKNVQLPAGKTTIDISSLAAGFYLVKVTNSEGTRISTLIKN